MPARAPANAGALAFGLDAPFTERLDFHPSTTPPSPGPRARAPVRPPPTNLVPPPQARSAVAPHSRSLPHPGVGGHAPANAGGPGHPQVPRVPAQVSHHRSPP